MMSLIIRTAKLSILYSIKHCNSLTRLVARNQLEYFQPVRRYFRKRHYLLTDLEDALEQLRRCLDVANMHDKFPRERTSRSLGNDVNRQVVMHMDLK